MTFEADRGAGLPTVCPFVAFADERDLRAAEPDRRHRCYAEARPAPRALTHQTRYCLSPGFTACPTFQDWATSEGAQVADDAVPTTAAASVGFFDEPEAAAVADPSRNGTSEDFAEAGSDQIAGAGADQVAGAGADEFADQVAEESAGAAASGAPARVPDWDRPRPRRDYPRLGRSRRIAPVVAGLIVLAIAALALFLLPSIITGMFGRNPPSPNASASPTVGVTATPGPPTPTPAPASVVYVVRAGDTMSKIAMQFDVGLEELIAANPEIGDPDKITVGDQLTIPTPGASPGASPTGSAAP